MNRRALVATAVVVVLGIALDYVTGDAYFPGYAASIGLIGAVVLIIGGKTLGKVWLKRPEGYYERFDAGAGDD